jgi:hypothetical protein
VKNFPKCGPARFFVKINTQLLPWKKEAQNFGLLLLFSQNLHKIRPIWSPCSGLKLVAKNVKKIIALVIAVCVYFFSIRISSRLRR